MKKYLYTLKKRKVTLGNKRKLSGALFLLLSFIFLFTGTFCHNTGKDYLRNITIQSEGEEFSIQWLQSMLSENAAASQSNDSTEKSFSFAAWTEQKEQTILDKAGGRQCSTDVIAVYGSSCCLLPMGKNLSTSDEKGCIIGKGLAMELFGTFLAEGRCILWQDREWIVRGVVSEPSRILMVEASNDIDNLHFNRISLMQTDNADKRTTGENFLLHNNLSARILRWDYLYQISWLKEMIPGEWSDFESWKKNFEEYRKALHLVNNTEKSVIESTGLHYQKKGRWLTIAGTITLAFSITLLLVHNNKQE